MVDRQWQGLDRPIAPEATLDAEADKWETIQKAKTNSAVRAAWIINAVLLGQIPVHRRAGNARYHGLMVCAGTSPLLLDASISARQAEMRLDKL